MKFRNAKRYCVLLIFLLSATYQSAAIVRHTLQTTEKLLSSEPDSALLIIKELMITAIERHDSYSEARCNQQIGKILFDQSLYNQSLRYFYKAQAIFEKLGRADALAGNLNSIGQVYLSTKNNSKAMLTFREALKISIKERSSNDIAAAYARIGMIYERQKDHDQAIKYQEKALSYYKSAANQNGIASVYENIGSIYERKNNFQQALPFFFNALALFRKGSDKVDQAEVLNNIGDVYRKTAHYNEALAYTRQAQKLAATIKNNEEIWSAQHDLAKTYELLGKFDSAYYENDAARKTNMLIAAENNMVQMNILQTVYEVGKKNAEIRQLGIERKNTRIFGLLGLTVAILIGLLAWSIFSRQKLRLKTENIQLAKLQLEMENDLAIKRKELTSYTLSIIQKNKLVESLRDDINTIIKDEKRDQRKELKQLSNTIQLANVQEKNWEDFRAVFETVHTDFFSALRIYPSLTTSDLRLLALMKMNLSSADISTMTGVSADSLRTAKYRLRKKLLLSEGTTLLQFVQQIDT